MTCFRKEPWTNCSNGARGGAIFPAEDGWVGNEHDAIGIDDFHFANCGRGASSLQTRSEAVTHFESALNVLVQFLRIVGLRAQTLGLGVFSSLFSGIKNFVGKFLGAHVGVVQNLLEEKFEEHHGQDE